MAEQVKTGYQRLFEVRALLHRYLYKGVADFALLTTSDEHDRRLLAGYDVRRFLSFIPAPATGRRLKQLGCVVKNTPLGFLVASPDVRSALDAAVFDFYVTVENAAFATDNSFAGNKRGITEIQHEGRAYRYKENAFFLTNRNRSIRATGGKNWLCLSGNIPAFNANAAYPPDALTTSNGTDLQQLTATGWQQVAATEAKLPVFLNQGDIPVQTTPGGATIPGIVLEDGLPNHVFALIRIETLPPSDDFSLLEPGNNPTDPVLRNPVFEVHFLPAP